MGFLNSLYNLAADPFAAVNKIMDERRLGTALLGYLSGALSIMMVLGLRPGGMGQTGFVLGLLLVLFLNLCGGFFFAASAHLFLEISTGKGRAAGLFVLIGLSEFCKTLLVAFALIDLAFPAVDAFSGWVFFAVLLLQLFVVLFMMQIAYGMSKLRTFFALAAAFVPAFVSIFAFFALGIWLVVWLIAR